MPTPVSHRVRKRRDALRAAGLRPIQIWVPDTRRPGFAAECARQIALVNEADARDPELDRFLAGRQQRGLLLEDAQSVAPLHRAVALGGLLALIALSALLRRRLGFAGVALVVLVLAAAVGNAAITGGLSGPAVRYQARLAWLLAFAPAALALAALSVRQAVEDRQAA